MTIDQKVLEVLLCPATRRPLRLADADLVARVNRAIAARSLRNAAGELLTSPLDGGLLRDDGAVLYPILDDIPCLLADEGIPLTQLASQELPHMADKTIFQRIIDREIPAAIEYEDDLCLAFRDIAPQAPTHVLVIPKQPLRSLADATESDRLLLGHLLVVISKLSEKLELGGGYRVVLNCGRDAGQSVGHLHFHLLGGRSLAWPPG